MALKAHEKIPWFFFGGTEGEIYICGAKEGIYRYSMEEKESSLLLDWTGSGMDGESLSHACPYGEGFLCIFSDTGLSLLSRGEKKEKQVLTLGIFDPNMNISDKVAAFNSGQDQVQIQIKNYATVGAATGDEKLQLDIASGDCPDILDGSVGNMESLMDKGAFVDLYDFMEEDKEMQPDLFLDNVLKLMERDGKLYFLPSCFKIKLLACKKGLLGDADSRAEALEEGISMETLSKLSKKYPKKSITGTNNATGSQGEFFADVLSGKVSSYFASQEAEEKLKQLLLFCKDLPISVYGKFPSYDSPEFMMEDGSCLFIKMEVLDFSTFFQELENGYGKAGYALVGYPSAEGSGVRLSLQYDWPKLGISSSCKNKEAAWEFLRFLMTEESQEEQIFLPVRKEAFEKRLDGEGRAKRHLSKKEKETAYKLVNSADYIEALSYMESSLVGIIQEEASGYFSGDKDMEETIKVIENRVNLYKNERE